MCNFPAGDLLREMRRVAREADESSDPAKIMYACAYAKATLELRLAHEDVTGCQCWYQAVDAARIADEEVPEWARQADGEKG